MYKDIVLTMKKLEMYLVPCTASSCFLVLASLWLLSGNLKKVLEFSITIQPLQPVQL